MNLFLVLAVVGLIVGLSNVYQNRQRKKEIVVLDAAIKALGADSKSSVQSAESDLRKEISSIRDHATATRAFAESKALRNTVVVSTSDHAQIVKDHRR